MMKKSILYVVSAVLLGVAVMLTPIYLLLTPRDFLQPQPHLSMSESAYSQAVARNELAYGITPHFPADEISIGLMSAFSLIFAFVVFRQFKKKSA